jgi:alcohol dehydrogenase class IV
MALASTYAGLAFTRANVGNVHAIAHALGGLYHTPHGLANAIMLPYVLRFYGAAIQPRLALLAVRARLGSEDEGEGVLAGRFLDAVESLNATVGIPRQLDTLQASDIPALAKSACHEADNNYPVPRRMSQAECEALLRLALPAALRRKPAARKPRAATAAAGARPSRAARPAAPA